MFKGSYVALVTPFHEGRLDEKSLRQLVNWHINQGTHGLVPMGTTGEAPTVTSAEHKRTIEIVVEETQKRIPVIAGAGSNNPIEALDYAQAAEACGADAILCVAGYYNRPSQLGLYEHFKYLHNNTSIPIIIYNIPPRAIVDIEPDTMAQLADLPRVVGVKDATMDLSRVSLEKQLIDKDFSFFSGEDITALAYNAMGGSGCISVAANIVPALFSQMQSACLAGDYQQALSLHEQLVPLYQALTQEPNPAGIKYAMSLAGLCRDEVRLPILPVSEQTKQDIKKALIKLSVI